MPDRCHPDASWPKSVGLLQVPRLLNEVYIFFQTSTTRLHSVAAVRYHQIAVFFPTLKMSQEQQRRPRDEKLELAIRYGDVFNVSGDLASKPVAPQDAAMMQSAEQTVLGQTQNGGPAAAMQSATTRNERAGLVGHRNLGDLAVASKASLLWRLMSLEVA